MSPRPQESLQQRPSVLHNTSSKNLQSSEHSGASVLRSISSPRYPNFMQRAEAYPDSSGAKELTREGSKNQSRGVMSKHQESKSESKHSSPSGGNIYSPFSQGPGGHIGLAAGRGLTMLAPESGRDKSQNKGMSLQEHELRALAQQKTLESHGVYGPPDDRLSPSQQNLGSVVKSSQRVVTLAQHISEVIKKDYMRQSQGQSGGQPMFEFHSPPILDLTRTPSAPQTPSESTANTRFTPESSTSEQNRMRDRSPPQSKVSPVSLPAECIEPVSPAGGASEPDSLGAACPIEQAELGLGSRSPTSSAQPPAFFSKLTENNSAIVKSKKEMIKKMVVGSENDFNSGQPGTEIFNMPASATGSSVSMRCQPPPDSSGNTIGLEAIIRKALMGKYEDQGDERPPSNSVTPLNAGGPSVAAEPRNEEPYSLSGKAKSSGRSNGRKTKSPAPGLSGGERPSSVSSVHSEGDCNRRTPLTNRVWEDRPSSTGPYPCNPFTMMRLPGAVMPGPSPSPTQPTTGPPPAQSRTWEEEPKPLLCSQYETLSDSE